MRKAKLFELGSGDVYVEVLTLGKGFTIDFRLMGS
jgi:hypothetical protein